MNTHGMRDVRGTVMLCDQLYPSVGGKWIIAGTYTHWNAAVGKTELDLPPLNIYIRFQVEQAGAYQCELQLMHRKEFSAPLRQQRLQVRVDDPLVPCEMGCMLPPFRVSCPQAAPRPGERICVPLLLWLTIGGNDIASCPLNVNFQPLPGEQD